MRAHDVFRLPVFILLVSVCSCGVHADKQTWQVVDTGLSIGVFDCPQKSHLGDSRVTVIRIDPKYHTFKLLCGSQHQDTKLTAKQWCEKFNLICAINAGMYHKDHITHVGYLKSFDHLNNPRLNKDNTILAFNRIDSTVPEIQIIDRKCQDFSKLRHRYNSLCQSIRMVSCKQRNVWSQQSNKWSTAAIGIDKKGNVLLIFCRSPYSVHDFINILLSLPIGLYNAMYLEGGPEASLCLWATETAIELFGSYEDVFNPNDDNNSAWPIPNVIGVVKKLQH